MQSVNLESTKATCTSSFCRLKSKNIIILPKKGQIKSFSERVVGDCRTLAAILRLESDIETASISRFGPFLNLNRF